ncbi:MAG: hypothetical protein EOM24_28760, partial [Chloroflexia bacterium]|nr:hypothetical protein [Chloroflexia bacterium]
MIRILLTPPELSTLAWPTDQGAAAVEALARRVGLHSGAHAPPAPGSPSPEQLARQVEIEAARLGLEAEAVAASYGDIEALLRNGGPALLRLPPHPAPPAGATDEEGNTSSELIALLGGRWGHLRVLTPALEVRHVPLRLIRDRLCARLEEPWRPDIDRMLAEASITDQQAERVRRMILAEQLSALPIEAGWMLRLTPAANLRQQAHHARLSAPLATLVG